MDDAVNPIPAGDFFHAPVHHRALTPHPASISGTADQLDSSEGSVMVPETTAIQPISQAVLVDERPETWLPHRMPTHPDPAHHRPVHVAGLAAAQQIASAGVPRLDATQVLPNLQVNGPGAQQPHHLDFRGRPVLAHNPGVAGSVDVYAPPGQAGRHLAATASSGLAASSGHVASGYAARAGVVAPNAPGIAGPNGMVGGPMSQPSGAYRSVQVHPQVSHPAPVRQRTHWFAGIISGVLAATLATVATAAWFTNHNPVPTVVTTPGEVFTPSLPGPDGVPVIPGPVSDSTIANPYWRGVAAAVGDSVVSIQASITGSGSVGSGFVLDQAGHVLTNNHVIAGANAGQVQVTLADGRLYHATVVGGDTFTDLAVVLLQNPPSDLVPVVMGDSDNVTVGEPVLAIGNPLGLPNTVTTGVVSAINRPVTATGQDDIPDTVTNAIQIDAAINPGNSGGPLFDYQGRVIGVTSSIASLSSGFFGGTAGSIGLGFAIPINLAQHISGQIIENGVAQHPRLGVRLVPTTTTVDGISRRGARIAVVDPGTAAAEAGLQEDDVVIAMNGRAVTGSDSLTGLVRERRVGDEITLSIVRNGQLMSITATLGAMTDGAAVPVPEPELTMPPIEDQGSADTENESWLDEYGNEPEPGTLTPPSNSD